MADQKTPKSEMIRVPTALIPAVKELSRLHRQGHTIALLQALEELVNQFDSNLDIDIAPSSKSIKQLEKKLETKLEAISGQLEKLLGAISTISSANASSTHNKNRPRRQAHPYYQQPQVQHQPRNDESLAPRLGVSPQSLIVEREKLSAKEFISWSRNRDPMSVGWEWDARSELYHPVQ
ncbi:hypothetical protein [Nostoc sp. FACHB-145]|uniref:hypothetical protein n=1 Tax=Nostoc sp. FACHB-145 TaxID=2692836 RepID=UPI00168A1907|nr:hypothetical protein [Nostoc sp. FACHB-145]MBD2472398.1 hypothetical protein [Nostoc sp. FACHB-145]